VSTGKRSGVDDQEGRNWGRRWGNDKTVTWQNTKYRSWKKHKIQIVTTAVYLDTDNKVTCGKLPRIYLLLALLKFFSSLFVFLQVLVMVLWPNFPTEALGCSPLPPQGLYLASHYLFYHYRYHGTGLPRVLLLKCFSWDTYLLCLFSPHFWELLIAKNIRPKKMWLAEAQKTPQAGGLSDLYNTSPPHNTIYTCALRE